MKANNVSATGVARMKFTVTYIKLISDIMIVYYFLGNTNDQPYVN